MVMTPKIVFVGTFPPTEEGIATFNNDLATSIQKIVGKSAHCEVAAINLADTSPYYFDDRVSWEIDQEVIETYKNTAMEINSDPDVRCVVLQHEYGIFGGEWGEYICEFMNLIDKPIVTIMHTVLKTHENNPEKFRDVTDQIVENSSALIVLSKKSKEILSELYSQDTEKIYYIPHGIHPVRFVYPKATKEELGLSNKTVLTTFGLLSRDKGIEYVLEALPEVIEEHPDVVYQVLGQTHPIIRRREGENYRTELVKKVRELGLKKHVIFVDKYLSLGELLKYLQGTDLYIATSTNKNQAVSGTFSYAVGTGRAIVATEFTQSKEVVTKSMGRLVPVKNPEAYKNAILELLSNKKKLGKLHRNAYAKTRDMLWTNVAKQYIDVIDDLTSIDDEKLILPKFDISHLKKMTKKYGILQFAKYDIPDISHGYTLDDNARALIVTNWILKEELLNGAVKRLNRKYFKLIQNSQKEDGYFINYFDEHFASTSQNEDEMPEEPFGRAMWALAETITNPKISTKTKNEARKIWTRASENFSNLKHLRPKAFVLKALSIMSLSSRSDAMLGQIETLAEDLVHEYEAHKKKNWNWFESKVTYNNALLPESLALAYRATGKKQYLNIAKKTLSFLLKKTFMGEVYVPIGQNGWHKHAGKRSMYDQQPEDPGSMVLALITMYEITREKKYLKFAKHVFAWFLGNNLNGIPLYNFKTAGVYDGLFEEGVNKNQGAESLVSYLLARIRIGKYY